MSSGFNLFRRFKHIMVLPGHEHFDMLHLNHATLIKIHLLHDPLNQLTLVNPMIIRLLDKLSHQVLSQALQIVDLHGTVMVPLKTLIHWFNRLLERLEFFFEQGFGHLHRFILKIVEFQGAVVVYTNDLVVAYLQSVFDPLVRSGDPDVENELVPVKFPDFEFALVESSCEDVSLTELGFVACD